ncbi:hypothetical protein K7432_006918 [Basidiobolus ranarum]|uniref:Uncharacterized protein n=1 Tax=Basidiobolus ranarum TaxID=34480 RepID=A0ABR2WU79_9FUNG
MTSSTFLTDDQEPVQETIPLECRKRSLELNGNIVQKKVQFNSFLTNEYSIYFPVEAVVNTEDPLCGDHATDPKITTLTFKKRKSFTHRGVRVSLLHGLLGRSSTTSSLSRKSSFSEEACFSQDLKQHIKISSKRQVPYNQARVSLINRLRS